MEVEEGHPTNSEFVTLAPNVGPLQDEDGHESKETGYYSTERRSWADETEHVMDNVADTFQRLGMESTTQPAQSRGRYVTFHRGRTSRRFECSSTDGDLTEDEDLQTRRRRTHRSDGVTRQTRHQNESYSPSGPRQGRRSSGAAVSDGARGTQWAGPDDPLQGVGVDRPNVTGLRDPSPSGGTLRPSSSGSNEAVRRPVLPTL